MVNRKVEMKKVNSRKVSFSRRQKGLFTNASKLVALCDAQIAIVVFSPRGKSYCFGHPCVDTVIKRFIDKDTKRTAKKMEKLNNQLDGLLKQLQTEEKRAQKLENNQKERGGEKHLKPIDEPNQTELMEFKASLEDIGEQLKRRFDEFEASSSLLMLSKGDAAKSKTNKCKKGK